MKMSLMSHLGLSTLSALRLKRERLVLVDLLVTGACGGRYLAPGPRRSRLGKGADRGTRERLGWGSVEVLQGALSSGAS